MFHTQLKHVTVSLSTATPPSLNAPRPTHKTDSHGEFSCHKSCQLAHLQPQGSWGTQDQVGAHFLINTLSLREPSGTRLVVNGGTGRDVTGARGVWSHWEKLKNWELIRWWAEANVAVWYSLLFPPCNLFLSVAVMNAWLEMRLLPGWKPLTDLVFVLTCSTHSRLLLCGQSQSPSCSPPPLPLQFQAFKCSSLTFHRLLSRGHFPPLFLLFHSTVRCPSQPLWMLLFCPLEALNLNLSSRVVVHLHLFSYDVPSLPFHGVFHKCDDNLKSFGLFAACCSCSS